MGNSDWRPAIVPERVVIITSSLAPRDYGGIASYTRRLVDVLRGWGVSIVVIIVRPQVHSARQQDRITYEMDATTQERCIRLVPIEWQSSRSPYGALYLSESRAAQSIGDVIRAVTPDVVHLTTNLLLGGTVIQAMTDIDCPIVVTLTDSWWICPNGSLLRGDGQMCKGDQDGIVCSRCMFPTAHTTDLLGSLPVPLQHLAMLALRAVPFADQFERVPSFVATVELRRRQLPTLFESIDRAVAPSRFLRQMYLRAGMGRPEQIEYLPHGVDHQVPHSIVDRDVSTRLRFGFTSRLDVDKGVELLLEAFSGLPQGRAELHLWGSWSEVHTASRDRCMLLAVQVPDVYFHGAYRERDAAEVLSQIDVVVLPSLYPENAPLAVSEAFAASIPVIVANAGGMAELVEDECGGLVFERGSVDHLRIVMLRLIQEPNLFKLLVATIPKVPTFVDEVARLVEIYFEVQERYADRPGSLGVDCLVP